MKTGRSANKDEFAFLELNDGTTPTNLQALVPASVWPIEELRHTGTCVLVEGELKASPADAPGQVRLSFVRSRCRGYTICDSALLSCVWNAGTSRLGFWRRWFGFSQKATQSEGAHAHVNVFIGVSGGRAAREEGPARRKVRITAAREPLRLVHHLPVPPKPAKIMPAVGHVASSYDSPASCHPWFGWQVRRCGVSYRQEEDHDGVPQREGPPPDQDEHDRSARPHPQLPGASRGLANSQRTQSTIICSEEPAILRRANRSTDHLSQHRTASHPSRCLLDHSPARPARAGVCHARVFPAERVQLRAHANHHNRRLRGRRRNVPGAAPSHRFPRIKEISLNAVKGVRGKGGVEL